MKTSTIVILSATTMLGCGDLEREPDGIEVVESPVLQQDRCLAIDVKRAGLPFLGAEDGSGCHPHTNGASKFYQGGTIFFGDLVAPGGRAQEVHGLIAAKYLAMGAQASVLKFPTTDELDGRFGGGRFNAFQGGNILWKSGAAQAREVHGTNLTLFGALGGEWGNMGWPTSDEFLFDGRRKNDFEFGKIYTSSSFGTWPTLTGQNPQPRLVDAGFPQISSVTISGSTGAFISGRAVGFVPGTSATLRLTRPDNGVSWSSLPATVDANGMVTFPSRFAEQNQIFKVNDLVTVWVFQDTGHQAVMARGTPAGLKFNGSI